VATFLYPAKTTSLIASKQAFQAGMLMGGTTSAHLLETSAGVIIEREFQYITPTNTHFVS